MASGVSHSGGHTAVPHVVVQDGLHGLIKRWRSCRAISRKAATCVVTTDAVPTSHVRRSARFEESHHEHDHSPSRRDPSRSLCSASCESCFSSEPCALRLGPVRSIYCEVLVSRSTRAEAAGGRHGAPRANPTRHLAPPFKRSFLRNPGLEIRRRFGRRFLSRFRNHI